MTVLRDYAAAMTRPTLSLDSPADPRYDEVVAPDGALRPAWKGLAEIALSLTPDELHRVDGEITRFLADDGVSYLRPDTGAQPWQLVPAADAEPLEWRLPNGLLSHLALVTWGTISTTVLGGTAVVASVLLAHNR